MSVKISPDTVAILKNFSEIHQSLLFGKTNTIGTVAESKNVLAEAEIKEKFPREFGIYDLNEFLSTLNLFGDPSLAEFNEFRVLIKDDVKGSRSSCNYVFADSSMIPELPDKAKILKAIKGAEIQFDLTEADLASIQSAAGTLKSPAILVESDGKKVFLSTSDPKNSSSSKFSIEVGKGNGNRFMMILKVENLKLLKGSYEVKISKLKISQFKNTALDLTYWIAFEDDSTFSE